MIKKFNLNIVKKIEEKKLNIFQKQQMTKIFLKIKIFQITQKYFIIHNYFQI